MKRTIGLFLLTCVALFAEEEPVELFSLNSEYAFLAQDPDSSPVVLSSKDNVKEMRIPSSPNFKTFFSVEFLYWKYFSDLLCFGRNGVGLTYASPSTQIAITDTGTSFYPNFKFDPGYRINVGWEFGSFDFVTRYTWFYTHLKNSVSQSDLSSPFLPLNWLTSSSLSTSTYQQSNIAFALHYYYPELQFGYTFHIDRYLSLRPYMGLASILIDANLNVTYAFTPSGSAFQIAKSHGHSFSWAVGPKIGIDFIAHPLKNLGVFCNLNFTVQSSQLTVRAKETIEIPSTGSLLVVQKGQLQNTRTTSLFGFEIGPSWDLWFLNERYHLQLRSTWQTSTLAGGNVSFLNNNNADVAIGAELRGINLRALLEF